MAKDVGKRLLETTLAYRSGAYQWLRKNRAQIARIFAKQAQPSWKALVETAAADGKDFTANALRKAWLRVEADLAREAERLTRSTAKQPALPRPAVRVPVTHPRPPSVQPIRHDDNAEPDDEPDFDFSANL
jgi:hypothetical protein